MKIYLIGALKNPAVPTLAMALRDAGHEVCDEWYSPGPETDEFWRQHCKYRNLTFTQALETPHAKHVFAFDKLHIDKADAVVMLMPCGRSGHLEFGYSIGTGKRGYILMPGEPERYDVMYKFATGVFTDLGPLLTELKR